MTLNDLESPKEEFFVDFFHNFWLHHTFQQWIATARLEIDLINLRINFFSIKRSQHC